MSCPPLFKDLHKSTDDAFSKDFHQDCFNTKIATSYDMGEHGKGKITNKFDYNSSSGKPSAEIEFKHTNGTGFGSFLDGVVTTKTINSGSDLCKIKHEFNVKGAKVTAKWNQHLALNQILNVSKPELSIDLGKDKCSSQLNIIPASNFKGLDSVNLNTVMKAGPVFVGLHAGYGLAKGNIDHHMKLMKDCNGLKFALGLKNASDLQLVASKNLTCSTNIFGLCSWDNKVVHLNSNYGINNGSWGSQLCLEWANGKVGGMALSKGKCKVDLKTLAYHESVSMDINDKLGYTIGFGTKLGGDFFDNAKLGAALNFSL